MSIQVTYISLSCFDLTFMLLKHYILYFIRHYNHEDKTQLRVAIKIVSRRADMRHEAN